MAKRDEQQAITFAYYEQMQAIIRDLEAIDLLIPREVSRHPLVVEDMSENARYLIIARKDDLLGYIQTICRDHIEFGKQLTDAGWTSEQKRAWKKQRAAPKRRSTVRQMLRDWNAATEAQRQEALKRAAEMAEAKEK